MSKGKVISISSRPGPSKSITLPTIPSLLAELNQPFIHRDLSWLQFNDRVLEEARLGSIPLLERLKFLSITETNLDEFFMIRFSSLQRGIRAANRKAEHPKEERLKRIRDSILEEVSKFTVKQSDTFQMLASELENEKISIPRTFNNDPRRLKIAREVFEEEVLPLLGPPEKFSITNLALLSNLQCAAIFGESYWLPLPKDLPGAFVRQGSAKQQQFVFLLADLIQAFLGEAFRIELDVGLVRLTRDADIKVEIAEEDSASIPDIIRSGVQFRDRGRPVRLQYTANMDHEFVRKMTTFMKIKRSQTFQATTSLDLGILWMVMKSLTKSVKRSNRLFYPPLKPHVPDSVKVGKEIFKRLKQGDLLLHHPYDSFDSFVSLIRCAANDPKVKRIQLTVYRTDAFSPVIDALKLAAKKKKKVRVIIELRARFDELNNLKLTDEIRKAGIEVGFGFGKLKLHAKVALIERREGKHKVLYTHFSTGNYNASTARQYEDLAILSANPDLGMDAETFFEAVWNKKVPSQFKQLVTAPKNLHRKLVNLIDAEIAAGKEGKNARIVAKVNALVDEKVTDKLYEASQAGVKVDLIVRGACMLIPQVKGLSENIRVISVVDRFLEHSRIYFFEHSKVTFLSSADWMPRNFFSRLEIAFPVLDEELHEFIGKVVLPAYLCDTVKARELTSKGLWRRRVLGNLDEDKALPPGGKNPIHAQKYFINLAEKRYIQTSLDKRQRKAKR